MSALRVVARLLSVLLYVTAAVLLAVIFWHLWVVHPELTDRQFTLRYWPLELACAGAFVAAFFLGRSADA